MKWFNKFLSEPFQDSGNIVHFARDKFGRMLVIDKGEYRILSFDSIFEQSCMRIHYPNRLIHQYTQRMMLVLAYCQPKHITLFGLGGGSLLRALHHVLPECFFNVFELRQKVVDIAMDYFEIPIDERVTITVNNGLVEASNSESQTSDIIFSDMYNAYSIVQEQLQNEFLGDCSRMLTDRGWLVVNIHSLPKDEAAFLKCLNAHFPTVLMSSNSGNAILFASKCHPKEVAINNQHIDTIEQMLGQRFTPMLSRIKPYQH